MRMPAQAEAASLHSRKLGQFTELCRQLAEIHSAIGAHRRSACSMLVSADAPNTSLSNYEIFIAGGLKMSQVESESKVISFYLPAALDEKVEALAAEQRRSKSQTVALLLEAALRMAAAVKI